MSGIKVKGSSSDGPFVLLRIRIMLLGSSLPPPFSNKITVYNTAVKAGGSIDAASIGVIKYTRKGLHRNGRGV